MNKHFVRVLLQTKYIYRERERETETTQLKQIQDLHSWSEKNVQQHAASTNNRYLFGNWRIDTPMVCANIFVIQIQRTLNIYIYIYIYICTYIHPRRNSEVRNTGNRARHSNF